MYQSVNVEVAEVVDVMQRERTTALGGSVIIIDNFSSQHYSAYGRQLQPVASAAFNMPNNAASLRNYLLNRKPALETWSVQSCFRRGSKARIGSCLHLLHAYDYIIFKYFTSKLYAFE